MAAAKSRFSSAQLHFTILLPSALSLSTYCSHKQSNAEARIQLLLEERMGQGSSVTDCCMEGGMGMRGGSHE